MSRLQLALNVSDLDTAIGFYSRFFGVAPAKVRPGYANFTVADPPLKLVLIETDARGIGLHGALNHLGVEVDSTDGVTHVGARLTNAGLVTTEEHQTTCCFAVQDKVWVADPDRMPWEVYAVLADAPSDGAPGGDGTGTRCQLPHLPADVGCC